jgi:hypothetical protein
MRLRLRLLLLLLLRLLLLVVYKIDSRHQPNYFANAVSFYLHSIARSLLVDLLLLLLLLLLRRWLLLQHVWLLLWMVKMAWLAKLRAIEWIPIVIRLLRSIEPSNK